MVIAGTLSFAQQKVFLFAEESRIMYLLCLLVHLERSYFNQIFAFFPDRRSILNGLVSYEKFPAARLNRVMGSRPN
jgi:hypothetical protein